MMWNRNAELWNDDPVLALIAAPLIVADADADTDTGPVECTVTFAECTGDHVIIRVRALGGTDPLDLAHRPAPLLDDAGVEYPHVHAHRASGPLDAVVDWVYSRPSGAPPSALRLCGVTWSVRFRFPDSAASEPPS